MNHFLGSFWSSFFGLSLDDCLVPFGIGFDAFVGFGAGLDDVFSDVWAVVDEGSEEVGFVDGGGSL